MTALLRAHVTRLAATLADLRDRVRVAVAGELARAVAESVRQVVEAAVAGQSRVPRYAARPSPHSGAGRWDDEPGDGDDRWDPPHDPWTGDRYDGYDPDREPARPVPVHPEVRPSGPSSARTGVTAAVTAAVSVARWWVARRGTRLAAGGLGLGVGLLGLIGGPVLRTAVSALVAVAEILAATDALGAGAARLDHI